LFATLARRFISVAFKGLKERVDGEPNRPEAGRREKNNWLEGCDPAFFVRAESKGVAGVTVCKWGK
jgi:hypothetical protein